MTIIATPETQQRSPVIIMEAFRPMWSETRAHAHHTDEASQTGCSHGEPDGVHLHIVDSCEKQC